jgi:hypothetical protein
MGDDGVATISVTNPRFTFLRSIGLDSDPFANPVAEQELDLTEIPPRFYSYFTSPNFEKFPREKIFDFLRASHHAFVYGNPGSGKTTLRLNLEADCRTRLDNILVVTYYLGADIRERLTREQHYRQIARNLALDLFVQIVEQLDWLTINPTLDQIASLRQIFYLSECRLRQIVNRILENPHPNLLVGLGVYWDALDRPAARYVPSSQRLLELLTAARLEAPCPPDDSNDNPLEAGWRIARQWGFRRMFLLIDGVDARERTIERMMMLLEPLLQSLADWEHQGIFVKFFLPLELQKTVQENLANLHLDYIEDRIVWDKEALRALLRERFRVANSIKVDFDSLAGEGLEGKLDDLILDSAQGLPRRFLQIVNGLINVHLARAPQADKFTILDWEKLRQDWAFPPPLPSVK